MPELTVVHIGLLASMLVVGVIVGWFVRADRCAKEKIAVNASWQDQLESQQSEHNRLAEQNKSLMEQISQYQASQKDYSNRAKELSASLREAFGQRDEMQRQLKDTRAKLELAVVQRNKAREALQQSPAEPSAALKEKDDKIFHLSRELTSWQSRVPPLVERFQEKNQQVLALEEELERATTRLQELEDLVKSDQTRIEPLDAESLPDGGDASNEPNAMTSAHDTAEIQDQVDAGDDDDETHEAVFEGADTDAEVVSMSDFSAPASDGADDDSFDRVFAGDETADDEDADGGDSGDVELDDDGEAVTDDEPHDETELVSDGEPRDETELVADDEPQDETELVAEDEPRSDGTARTDGVEQLLEGERDDLQQIKGIGPSIEKTLNDLGVQRFHQLAEMSEYDIDRVAQQLRGFRSRIYREDWIGQARDLQYQKSSGRS